MVDNRRLGWSPTSAQVVFLCNRRTGVGADGLILIQEHPEVDFEMIYFNSDGSKSLCGNGSRCAIHFAHSLGMISSTTTFLTTDGIHRGEIDGSTVSFELFDVAEVEELDGNSQFVNTGSPHYLEYRDELDQLNVYEEGRKIRYDERFSPGGTNVNFVQIIEESGLRVRTYERGVEEETLSCGTGVTAAALGASLRGIESPVAIQTRGGNLEVSFERNDAGFKNIFLTGPATPVYAGKINL